MVLIFEGGSYPKNYLYDRILKETDSHLGPIDEARLNKSEAKSEEASKASQDPSGKVSGVNFKKVASTSKSNGKSGGCC